MTHYQLLPTRDTLHGSLSKTIPPVLTIDPEDIVDFTTLEADQRILPPNSPSSLSGAFMERSVPLNQGHALYGPIHVRGAHPGMTLSVRVSQILTGTWGWSHVGDGDLGHLEHVHFRGGEYFLTWEIDREKGTCTSHLKHSAPLSPFMGVMAVAPDTDDYVRTHIPGLYGADMNCKDITTGSVFYLPVYAESVLFSTGDGHARRGDGESSYTAVGCPMECVSLTFDLIDEPLASPMYNSPKGWITFGSHNDLTEAAYYALVEIRRLVERLYGFSSREALAMASVVVDVRITQLANGVRGTHTLLPHGIVTLWDPQHNSILIETSIYDTLKRLFHAQ